MRRAPQSSPSSPPPPPSSPPASSSSPPPSSSLSGGSGAGAGSCCSSSASPAGTGAGTGAGLAPSSSVAAAAPGGRSRHGHGRCVAATRARTVVVAPGRSSGGHDARCGRGRGLAARPTRLPLSGRRLRLLHFLRHAHPRGCGRRLGGFRLPISRLWPPGRSRLRFRRPLLRGRCELDRGHVRACGRAEVHGRSDRERREEEDEQHGDREAHKIMMRRSPKSQIKQR